MLGTSARPSIAEETRRLDLIDQARFEEGLIDSAIAFQEKRANIKGLAKNIHRPMQVLAIKGGEEIGHAVLAQFSEIIHREPVRREQRRCGRRLHDLAVRASAKITEHS